MIVNNEINLDGINIGKSCGSNHQGNFGFNSFNFMTFMLMIYNVVANTNNNINNNNNNNNNLNFNSISQNSQETVSNSDNMNMIMVMILPPGRKLNKRSNNGILIKKFLMSHFLKIAKYDSNCQSFQICLSIYEITKQLEFNGNSFNSILKSEINPKLCSNLFPNCVYM